MLRLIVIALVLGNLLLLGFQAANRAPAEPAREEPEPMAWEQPEDLPPIRLLRELEALDASERPVWQCFTVGPFETRRAMQEARTALESLPGEFSTRRTEALMELGYWVSSPSYDTFGGAGTELRRLREAGLDDLAVVADETGRYHVSMGYFLLEANARRRRDQVRELGFQVDTRLQREAQPRYWLDYRHPLGAERLRADLADSLPPGSYRAMPCPEAGAPDELQDAVAGEPEPAGLEEEGDAAEPAGDEQLPQAEGTQAADQEPVIGEEQVPGFGEPSPDEEPDSY